jgi:hypothetical protein
VFQHFASAVNTVNFLRLIINVGLHRCGLSIHAVFPEFQVPPPPPPRSPSLEPAPPRPSPPSPLLPIPLADYFQLLHFFDPNNNSLELPFIIWDRFHHYSDNSEVLAYHRRIAGLDWDYLNFVFGVGDDSVPIAELRRNISYWIGCLNSRLLEFHAGFHVIYDFTEWPDFA